MTYLYAVLWLAYFAAACFAGLVAWCVAISIAVSPIVVIAIFVNKAMLKRQQPPEPRAVGFAEPAAVRSLG